MIQGYSTLGAVALRIIADNIQWNLRSATHYTVHQVIEKVCFRKESVASCTEAPAYIWWWFSMDHGELSIEYDVGKLKEVSFKEKHGRQDRRYVPATNGELEVDELIGGFKREGWWDRDEFITRTEEAMIRMGVQPYQKMLSTYAESWSSDYWGESDCHYSNELLYVEPLGECNAVFLPVPLGDLGRAPTMKGLRFE